MWIFHSFMKQKPNFFKCGLLVIILCIIMVSTTYYKGLIVGVLSPLAGLLSIAPVDTTKLKQKGSVYPALARSFLRLLPLILINLGLLSTIGTNVQNIRQTDITTLITGDPTSMDMKYGLTKKYDCPVELQSQELSEEQSELKNFALGSEGAKVLEYPTPGHVASFYFLNFRLPWFIIDFKCDPAVLLQPENMELFSYMGWKGSFMVELSETTSSLKVLSLTHPDSEQLTKPRDLAVHFSDNLKSWFYVGSFTFDLHSESTQYFYLQSAGVSKILPKVGYVKIEILSNWGNVDYTTLSSIALLG